MEQDTLPAGCHSDFRSSSPSSNTLRQKGERFSSRPLFGPCIARNSIQSTHPHPETQGTASPTVPPSLVLLCGASLLRPQHGGFRYHQIVYAQMLCPCTEDCATIRAHFFRAQGRLLVLHKERRWQPSIHDHLLIQRATFAAVDFSHQPLWYPVTTAWDKTCVHHGRGKRESSAVRR